MTRKSWHEVCCQFAFFCSTPAEPFFHPDLREIPAAARSGGQGWPVFGPPRQRRWRDLFHQFNCHFCAMVCLALPLLELGSQAEKENRLMSQLNKISVPTGTTCGTAIFVHGLGGDAFATWRAKPGDDSLWPRWLAEDVPGLAVFSVGYPAAVSNWQGTSMPLQDRAGNVLEGLLVDLDELRAPIVFVCHSLGGLVVKQLLRRATDMQHGRREAAELLARVRGIAFMATPHNGSDLANVLNVFKTLLRVSAATESLIKNDPALRDLNTWYRGWSLRCAIQHRVFFETIALHGVTTVDPGSSDPGLPNAQPVAIDADHIQICKPENREDLLYKSTRDFIRKLIARRSHEQFSISEARGPPSAGVTSYSQKDGAEFANDLRASLSVQALSIWQDIVALEGGHDWWSQIEDALKAKALNISFSSSHRLR